MELYDSYQRSVRHFKPLIENEVRMYACGPTVYNYAHIGNLRTYICEDLLRRTLEFYGYSVKHVINITDVGHLTSDADTGEDKIELGAKRSNASAWEIAEKYTRAFQDDCEQLNILAPAIWCKATDHVAEQISDIKKIEHKGFTYITSDGVYFNTKKLKNYGYLARLDVAGLNAGSRVDIGEKKHATDFALWKFSPADQVRQMEWDSPWGRGFPGWHIECSAMAVKYLGKEFDIHCGGKDHIPIHHCNEIAQAEVCYGTTLANFWMHSYFLQADQEKMSKSSDNFLRINTLSEQGYDPLSYRYLCLTTHYRKDLKFRWESLTSAQIALDRLRSQVHEWGEPGEIDRETVAAFTREAYFDLGIPSALAVLWGLVKSKLPAATKKATVLHCDQILGLRLAEWKPLAVEIPTDVLEMAREREKARENKEWQVADRLRDSIHARGFVIDDSVDGSEIRCRPG